MEQGVWQEIEQLYQKFRKHSVNHVANFVN